MADVRYQFVSSGAGAVESQILSIEAAFVRSTKAAEAAGAAYDKATAKRAGAGGGAGAGAVAGAGAGGGGAGGGARGASSQEKLALRVAADQERAAKRSADAQIRENKRSATEQGRNAAYVAKIRDKHFADEQKSGERAAKRTADAQARESKRSASEQAKSAQYVARIKDKHFADEQKATERVAAAKNREAASAAKKFAADNQRTHTKGRDAFEASKQEETGKRWQKAGSIAGHVFKAVGTAAFAAGAASLGMVGQAAREGIQLQDAANRISISARGAGETSADPRELAREFQKAALQAPGIKAEDVAEGAASFVAKTGDLGAARRFASTFATTASASGSSVQDIAAVGADLSQKFDIQGIEEMQAALASLTMQGKSGAFELKEAAALMGRMSSAAARFGLKGGEGLKVLGGLSQIARSSTGSSEQAATAVEATFRQLVSKSKELQAGGIQVFKTGSKSETRDVRDVIVDTIAKKKGSLPALQQIFGDEGIRGISPLISTFNNTRNSTTGTEDEKTAAGVAALREALANAIDAPGDWSEVVKDAAQAQQGAQAQLDGAWEQIKERVSIDVVPALAAMAPKLVALTDAIGPALSVFEMLVDFSNAFLLMLQDLGLINDHSESKALRPKEELAKVTKDLEDTAKINGPLTLEQTEKAAKDRQRQMTLQMKLGVTDQMGSTPLAKMVEGYAAENMPDMVAAEGADRMWAKQQEAMIKGGADPVDIKTMGYDVAPGGPTAPKPAMTTVEAVGTLGAAANGGALDVGAFKEACGTLLRAAGILSAAKAPSIVDGAQIP